MNRVYWIVGQALVVAGGVILMFIGRLFREGGVWYSVCSGTGVALISVGTVALVYEIMARQQMLADFKRMLEDYTGARWVKAAGIRWAGIQDGERPRLIGDGKCPTRLQLAALDLFKFRATHINLVIKAVEDGTCESLEIVFQDPDSRFAFTMDEFQPGRRAAMIATQAAWLRDLASLRNGRPRVSVWLASKEPVLGGLVIAEMPTRSQAIWSPYLAVPTTGDAPTFDVAGPGSELYNVLVEHFRNLCVGAASVTLPSHPDELSADQGDSRDAALPPLVTGGL